MFAKIKHLSDRLYAKRHKLEDIQFIGQVLFVILVLLISWSGVKAIQTNYTLQKQITTLKQQNQVQQLANSDMQLQNEYYNSNQYLKLAARENFGLADPGETEVLVPKSVALAQLVPVASLTSSAGQKTAPQSGMAKNFHAWIDFILHRHNSIN